MKCNICKQEIIGQTMMLDKKSGACICFDCSQKEQGYSEKYQRYEILLHFSNGKVKKLSSKETREDAYNQGINALKKHNNAVKFILYQKNIEKKYLTEIRNKK